MAIHHSTIRQISDFYIKKAPKGFLIVRQVRTPFSLVGNRVAPP